MHNQYKKYHTYIGYYRLIYIINKCKSDHRKLRFIQTYV